MNGFDTHCNKNKDFIFHIMKKVKSDEKPIGEFQANFGETTKVLSYLLPTCKFEIINSDEYQLTTAEKFLVTQDHYRNLSERVTFYPWDINYSLNVKNYHIAFSENYLSHIPFKNIAPIWSNLETISDIQCHLITLTERRDISFYRNALLKGSPRCTYFTITHLDSKTKQIILETNTNNES